MHLNFDVTWPVEKPWAKNSRCFRRSAEIETMPTGLRQPIWPQERWWLLLRVYWDVKPSGPMLCLMLLRNGILHKSHVLGVKFASIQAKQLAEEKAKEHEEPASKPTTGSLSKLCGRGLPKSQRMFTLHQAGWWLHCEHFGMRWDEFSPNGMKWPAD